MMTMELHSVKCFIGTSLNSAIVVVVVAVCSISAIVVAACISGHISI